jgi:hypothetical protein
MSDKYIGLRVKRYGPSVAIAPTLPRGLTGV